MTISATVFAVDAGGAQTGSQDLAIPSGCTCVAALWHHYDGGTTIMSSLTLGGEALTLSPNVGSGGSFLVGGGVGYRNNPLTGTRAFAWDWGAGGAREEGGRIYVIAFEGSTGAVSYVDSDWNGADDATNPGPLTLTSATGGAVWAVGQSYGATNPDLSASGAQTVVNNNEAYNYENYDVAYVNSVGASTTNVSMSSVYYSSLGAVSVQEAAGGPTYTLTADGGSYTLTGTAASTLYNRVVTAAGGSYTLTGTAATLTHNYSMPVDPGSYTLTGTAAGTVYNRVIAATAGSYTLTGTAAGTLYNRVVVADGGTYSLTGSDVTLTYTPAGGYTLTCDVGSYTLTGTSANTAYNRVITADGGSYSLTGIDATLARNFSMPADSGSYTLTGTAAGTLYNRVLPADGGSYVLTGSSATTTYSGQAIWTVQQDQADSWAVQSNVSITWSVQSGDGSSWAVQ